MPIGVPVPDPEVPPTDPGDTGEMPNIPVDNPPTPPVDPEVPPIDEGAEN